MAEISNLLMAGLLGSLWLLSTTGFMADQALRYNVNDTSSVFTNMSIYSSANSTGYDLKTKINEGQIESGDIDLGQASLDAGKYMLGVPDMFNEMLKVASVQLGLPPYFTGIILVSIILLVVFVVFSVIMKMRA